MDKLALLAALAPRVVDVNVDGIGTVKVRELSAPEVVSIRDACKSDKDDFGFRLVVAAVQDETGAPMFTIDDLPSLRSAAQSRIGDLVARVMEANGFQMREVGAKNA